MLQKLSSMKSALRAVTAAAVLGSASMGAIACGSEPYLGEICTFAFNYCPKGFALANGSSLPISSNQALFAVLGNIYGGNNVVFKLPDLRGRTIVGVGQSPLADMPSVTLGQELGQAVVKLTASQLPLHPIIVPAGALTGTATLDLSGGSIRGQIITGSITVEGLNGDTAPAGGVNIPTATANTVGKNGGNQQFYPSGTTKIALPSSHNLAVTGGTISATATGTVTMPRANVHIYDAAGTVSPAAVQTMQPSLGLLQCIATQGLFPPHP